MTLTKNHFENIVCNGENAGNRKFLLLQAVFYPSKERFVFQAATEFVICKSKKLSCSKEF